MTSPPTIYHPPPPPPICYPFRPLGFYHWAVRPALFALDPEHAHDLTLAALRVPMARGALRVMTSGPADRRLRQRVLGIDFDNPVGLAAGLDKQGTAVASWGALGFGFAEVGTVTPLPQPGNPRPRLFRLPDDQAIINRFGFNSAGATAVARNLGDVRAGLRIGINIGRNRDTPNERAAGDFVRAAETLSRCADYVVVNVSSPNTSGLRDLQEGRMLRGLIEQVVGCLRGAVERTIPVMVKLSPDMTREELLRSVDAAVEGGAAGVIATNTTTARDGLRTQGPVAGQTGGLSGAPLRTIANDVCRRLFKHLGPKIPIVGVGGISTADHAYERIRSGATLVQLYTGLVYAGPGVVSRIVRGLAERLERDRVASIGEARGIDVT